MKLTAHFYTLGAYMARYTMLHRANATYESPAYDRNHRPG